MVVSSAEAVHRGTRMEYDPYTSLLMDVWAEAFRLNLRTDFHTKGYRVSMLLEQLMRSWEVGITLEEKLSRLPASRALVDELLLETAKLKAPLFGGGKYRKYVRNLARLGGRQKELEKLAEGIGPVQVAVVAHFNHLWMLTRQVMEDEDFRTLAEARDHCFGGGSAEHYLQQTTSFLRSSSVQLTANELQELQRLEEILYATELIEGS